MRHRSAEDLGPSKGAQDSEGPRECLRKGNMLSVAHSGLLAREREMKWSQSGKKIKTATKKKYMPKTVIIKMLRQRTFAKINLNSLIHLGEI